MSLPHTLLNVAHSHHHQERTLHSPNAEFFSPKALVSSRLDIIELTTPHNTLHYITHSFIHPSIHDSINATVNQFIDEIGRYLDIRSSFIHHSFIPLYHTKLSINFISHN